MVALLNMLIPHFFKSVYTFATAGAAGHSEAGFRPVRYNARASAYKFSVRTFLLHKSRPERTSL